MYYKRSFRKSDTYSLKEALEAHFNVYKLKDKFDGVKVMQSWGEIMGLPIADQTSEIFIKNDVLFVRIKSAVLRSELQMSKSKVLFLLNQKFSYQVVKDITFL